MLEVIELWNMLLPGWIYANILDQMILPKINEGVEAWDPMSDNIPIHAWIHPWLPILGNFTNIYPFAFNLQISIGFHNFLILLL